MELIFGIVVMITITGTAHLLITIINIVMAAQKCQEIVACGVIMTQAAVGSSVMMI
jgi:hypothetical protein